MNICIFTVLVHAIMGYVKLLQDLIGLERKLDGFCVFHEFYKKAFRPKINFNKEAAIGK